MRRGRVAQLGERLVRNEEAEGSNPFSSTNYLAVNSARYVNRLRSLKSQNRTCSGFCSGLFCGLTIQRGDSFTQDVQVCVRVAFGDRFRSVSQQVANIFNLHFGCTKAASKRVTKVVPSEVLDSCLGENLTKPLAGRL